MISGLIGIEREFYKGRKFNHNIFNNNAYKDVNDVKCDTGTVRRVPAILEMAISPLVSTGPRISKGSS